MEHLIKLLKPDTLPSQPGSEEYFSGSVNINGLIQGEEPSCQTCAKVKFEPSARSAWHFHPKGQLLVVLEGSGFVQEWQKPAQAIQKGDIIWTPPDVKHWHGASPSSRLTHLAIQETLNGKGVEWLEKVSDDYYLQQLG